MDPSAASCNVVTHDLPFTTTSRCKNSYGWRRDVRNFTPSWFSVNMGTGIVSILLHNLQYNGSWLYYLSVVVFCLNISLFVTFLLVSILRYSIWPEIWTKMLRHPVQSLFLGTFPMGLATIVNMIVFVCVPIWGTWAVSLAGRLCACERMICSLFPGMNSLVD